MDSKTIGALLKNARESRRLTLQNVADRTRVKMTFLKAIEEGDLAVFDAPIYARNFIRTYARFLRIDESQVMPLLEDSAETPADKPQEQAEAEPEPTPRETQPGTGPSSALLALAGVLVVAGGMYLFKVGFFRSTVEIFQPEPESEMKQTTDGDAAAPEKPAEAGGHSAQIRALEDVWMFWEADGQSVEKILSAGEVVNVSFSERLRVRIGNTNGLKFVLDGEDIPVHTEKVYDRIFSAQADGVLAAESPRGRDLQRFRSRSPDEETQ
ncbi:helix-turn-helix domain-containing protein [bacterium]|nr:helix-turn-helix domain-containing protein [bacterium]